MSVEQTTDLDGMSAEEIAKATREGRLEALLSGDRDAIANAKADALIAQREAEAHAPAGNVDQGARGTPSTPKYDEAWLATATPEQIAKATSAGHLSKLL